MQLKTLGSVAGIVKSLGDGARSFQEVTAAVEGLTLAQTRAFISTTSLEAEEIKAIFAAKGLEGAELQEAVAATVNAQAHYKLGGAIGGAGNAFKGLAMVIKANPILTISSVFLLVIAGLNKIKQSIDETAEELRNKAAESADTLTESLSNLGDYQKKIEDLKDAINSDDISQSEATEKRKQLLEIQEELIKKYGKEKEAVDYITESIQGETTALGNLQTIAAQNYLNNNIKQIEEANNYLTKLNEQTAPLPFTTVGVGQDPTVVKYEHYADLVSKQIAPMAELLYTDAGKTTVNGISFKGNYEELISQYDEVLSNIRKYLSDNPINGNSSDEEKWQAEKLKELESYISGLRSRIDNDEELQKYQKIYNTALDSVLLTSNTYSEYYNKLIEAKNKYTEALTSGNQDEITKSYTELRNLFNEIFNLDFIDEDNVSGESIKAWFEDIQEKINLQSKETPVIINVQAELKDSPDGYNNKIKEIAAKNNYTSADIDEIISKGDLPGQTLSADEQSVYDSVKGYVDLWNSVAKATGQSEIKVEEYIDILEKLGIVQKTVAEGSESSFALSKDQTKELKSVHSDVDKLNKAYQNLFAGKLTTNDVAELVDLFPTLGEYVDWTDEKFGNLAEGIDKVIKERPQELIGQLEEVLNTQDLSDEAKKSIQSMIAALKQLKPELKDTKTLIEDIQKAIKGVSSSISTLIGFTKEISSDGALSLSSIDTIMTDDTYKSLRPYINDMEGMQTAITELVAKQKDAYEDLYNAEMYENDYEAYRAELDKKEAKGEAYLNNSVKEIQNEVKDIEQQYNVDLTNWDNLSETKKSILQNTNAELLGKQISLINDFAEYYNTDLKNFKNTTEAKAAILENFRQSQVYKQVLDTMTSDRTESGMNYDPYSGEIHTYATQQVRDKVNSILAASGLTYEDYERYMAKGEFTDKGNSVLQKTLDEIVKTYTINPTEWDKMTANIKGTGSSNSSSSSSKNYIDWIERRLKKFAQTTKEIFAKVADYISFNNQNSQLRKAINAIRDEIAVNERAYQAYMDEANKIGLASDWVAWIQNGGYSIQDISNLSDDLKDKISRYKELYDNAINCKNAVDDLRKTEKEYANQMLSNVEKYYSNRIEYANADAEYYNSLDTDNVNLNKNFDVIRKSYNEQISYIQKEYNDLLNTLNSLVSNGSIKYQSDEWYEWWAKIQKCNVEVRNTKKSIHDLANEELQNIQGYWDNRIGVYDNTISYLNAVGGDSTRKGSKDYKGLSSAYNTQIGYINKQVSELQTRLDKAVKAGDIEKYSDKWYEWIGIIEQGKEKVVELQTSIHQLAVDEFNDISTRYDNLINKIEHKNSLLEESISRTQEKGYIVSTRYYDALITNEQNNISKLSGKRNDLYANLQQAIKSGNIQEGSEEWHKMVQEIENVDLEIAKANTSVIKFNNSIRDIQWQVFDLLQDRISQISTESNFLINLMKNDDLYVKKGQGAGQLTNQGLSTMGLHGVNYNVYMAQSNKYAQEILKIDKQLAKDPYNQTLINRRKELLKLQQDMIISANDEKQAIVSMVKDGIELELSSLKELIDKYNESLDKQKDLYDYQKKVKEQTKEIASLEKQMMAFAGDNSEETKAKVQQLKVDLETARENLQETQYDKFVSDSKKLLDDFYNDYETILNQRLDNVDSLISDMIDNINNNTDTIKQTLIDESGNVGYQISSTMNDIWNSGTKPVLSEYNTNFLNTSNNVVSAINNLTNSINNMIIALDNTANKNTTVKTTSNQSTTTVKQTMPTNNSTNKINTNNSKNKTNTNSIKNNTNTNSSKSINGTSSGFGKGSTNNNSTQKNTNNKSTRTDKENYGVALAIWNGNYGWGAGSTRVKRLTTKGFDANKVQSIVNKIGKDGYVFTGSWYGKYYGIKDLSPYHYNKYKQGQYSINHNQMAWMNENGNSEVIIRRSDGAILTPLAKDDMILNSQATDNLFSIATDPNTFIKESLFDSQNNAGTANINNVNNNCSVSVDTINFNLPNVKNYEDFFYAAQHDKRFEKMVQAMTVDKLFGGSSLKKYRV